MNSSAVITDKENKFEDAGDRLTTASLLPPTYLAATPIYPSSSSFPRGSGTRKMSNAHPLRMIPSTLTLFFSLSYSIRLKSNPSPNPNAFVYASLSVQIR